MGRKATPGLKKRAAIWHIDKSIGGKRVCRAVKQVTSQKRNATSRG
jgi:hypothetical protein